MLRQGSGLAFLFSFILVGYRLRVTSSEMLRAFSRIQEVLIAYAGFYLVYVIRLNLAMVRNLPENDFLRERSPILFFCGLFAALQLGQWLVEGASFVRPSQWFSVSLLALAAVLSGSRSIVASMLVTILCFFLARRFARPFRAALMIGGLALAFGYLRPQDILLRMTQGNSFLGNVVNRFVVSPESDFSFLQRSSQMVSIWELVKTRPFLGHGLGASVVWFDPYSLTYVETAFVDNGLGYLLLKTGALGLLTFLIFLSAFFRQAWWHWRVTKDPVLLLILGTLAYYSSFLPFGPSFFQFLLCFWIGLVLGCLLLFSNLPPGSAKLT